MQAGLFCVKLGLTHLREHRLMVFESRALRRILGPKREEVTGGWKIKLLKEEPHNLNSATHYNHKSLAGHIEVSNSYGFSWKT
jgi:hypothetical protein